MGAVITDAALQVRSNSAPPSSHGCVAAAAVADAETTSGFRARIQAEDLHAVLPWRGEVKVKKIHDLTEAMSDLGVETTRDLRGLIENQDTRAATRARLFAVHQVGRKTVDYLAILVGCTDEVAVDKHVQAFAREAGLEGMTDHQLGQLIEEAARSRGWAPGAVDAAIWNEMSQRG